MPRMPTLGSPSRRSSRKGPILIGMMVLGGAAGGALYWKKREFRRELLAAQPAPAPVAASAPLAPQPLSAPQTLSPARRGRPLPGGDLGRRPARVRGDRRGRPRRRPRARAGDHPHPGVVDPDAQRPAPRRQDRGPLPAARRRGAARPGGALQERQARAHLRGLPPPEQGRRLPPLLPARRRGARAAPRPLPARRLRADHLAHPRRPPPQGRRLPHPRRHPGEGRVLRRDHPQELELPLATATASRSPTRRPAARRSTSTSIGSPPRSGSASGSRAARCSRTAATAATPSRRTSTSS